MAKLGDIATIQSGGTPARSIAEYWEDGTIPWVKISDIKSKHLNQTEEMITEAGLENSSAKIFPKGTILYTIFATLGETSILEINAATNQAIAGISITDSRVLPDYLYYYLLSQKVHVQKIGRGVAQNNINMKLLRDFDVPLPSKEAQLNIIEQLNRVTELLFLRRQQLTKLDELIKARFVEMFGTYPDNPFGWNTGKIQDVVSDVRYGSSRPAVEGGKYPYLRMNNITYAGELDLTDTKRIDVPDSELDKCTVQRGDVLFNRTNSKELVGKTCVYNRDDMMVLAGFVIRVRVNERILPEFLVAFLNTDFSKQMLLGMCKTAIGQANINAKEMQNIGLYIPPIALQEQFVDLKKQTDKSKLLVGSAAAHKPFDIGFFSQKHCATPCKKRYNKLKAHDFSLKGAAKMTHEEQKDYANAKYDVIKALDSIRKLKPEYQKQLAEELFGAELCASAWKIFKDATPLQRQ